MAANALDAALDAVGVTRSDVSELDVEGSGDTVLSFAVDPGAWWQTWSTLRRHVDATGWWPLATTSWGAPVDHISRFDMQGPDGLDVAPSAILERVPFVDVDALLAVERENQRRQWRPGDEDLGVLLAAAPEHDDVSVELIRAALGADADSLDVERWLLNREIAAGGGPAPDPAAWYLEWFVPDDVSMLLLPTGEPWAATAFEGGHVSGYPHTDLRTAVLRRWHLRFGAELAANWGIMLQLTVDRPPSSIEDAWTVALEASLLWPDTAGGANGVPTRRHAIDLVDRDNWILHNRP